MRVSDGEEVDIRADAVYDWADAHGLLVWQEAAFACQMVPVRDAFLRSIREEVTQQVRRIGSHASLAIIGGNNGEAHTAHCTSHSLAGLLSHVTLLAASPWQRTRRR